MQGSIEAYQGQQCQQNCAEKRRQSYHRAHQKVPFILKYSENEISLQFLSDIQVLNPQYDFYFLCSLFAIV